MSVGETYHGGVEALIPVHYALGIDTVEAATIKSTIEAI